jgi:hypothetical protein
MRKNFMAMPILLKLLTAAGFGVFLIAISTMRPHSIISVFGRPITASDWWASGAGPFLLIVALLFCASAVMMLRRSGHARLAYIVALIALSISVPYVSGVTGVGVAAVSKSSLISNSLLTLVIALYLYLGRGTRNYFRSAGADGQGA